MNPSGSRGHTDRSGQTLTRSQPEKTYRSISLASKVLILRNRMAVVIVVLPDSDSLYRDFAAGLRKAHGKLPVAGIPRITRPRKKYGTVRGFSVVDPGGNWLQIS